MIINILKTASISFVLLLFSGCYTIVNHPFNYKQTESSIDELVSDNYSSNDYNIVNNYYCNHHAGNCHSHSNYYSCCTHNLSYDWWSGNYTCSSYYWNAHYNYAYGYYPYNWWGYNNWWSNDYSNDSDYADYNQERRDRSFERENHNSDESENGYTSLSIDSPHKNGKIVVPANYNKRNKGYKKKSKDKPISLFALIFGSSSSNSKRSSISSKESSSYKSSKSYKSEKSKKEDSSKSANNKRKQNKERR